MTTKVCHVAICPICGRVSRYYDDADAAEVEAQRHDRSNHSREAAAYMWKNLS